MVAAPGKVRGSHHADGVLPGEPHALSVPRSDRAYLVGDHGMVFRYRVVPITEVIPKAFDAPAMPIAPN